MDSRFNTKAYTSILRQAADLLEGLDTMNGHMSGNGKETVLECFARIATQEPESPIYEDAALTMRKVSEALRNTYEDLQDASGHFLSVSEHFHLNTDGGWFHHKPDVETLYQTVGDTPLFPMPVQGVQTS